MTNQTQILGRSLDIVCNSDLLVGEYSYLYQHAFPALHISARIAAAPRLDLTKDYDLFLELLKLPKEELEGQVEEAEASFLSFLKEQLSQCFDRPTVHDYALRLLALNYPEIESTENQWVIDDETREHISNKVFNMTILCKKVEKTTGKRAGHYHVYWTLQSNGSYSPFMFHEYLLDYKTKTLHKKHLYFPNEAEARLFIERVKKRYAVYFTELYPPVPIEWKELFSVCGVLAPGYRLQEGNEVYDPAPI